MENPSGRSRKPTLSVSQRVDAYFSQLDVEDHAILNELSREEPLLCIGESDEILPENINCAADTRKRSGIHKQQIFQPRHTITYWISTAFLFGAVLFLSASVFWLYQTNSGNEDIHILVTVGFFSATIFFLIGSYLGYYEVINAQTDPNPHRKMYCFPSPGKKTANFWTALAYLIGCVFYQITFTSDVLQMTYPENSVAQWLIARVPLLAGSVCFGLGGLGEMKLNKCWKWTPYKLGWYTAWFNSVGGILFFGAGMAFISTGNELVVQIPYVLGSAGYVIGSVMSLIMWKLQQFGLVYLPDLNRQYIYYYRSDQNKHDRREIVMYTDIFFLCLYVISAATGIYAVTFAVLCEEYRDWSKNFAVATLGAIGVVVLGSAMHRVPKKKPYSHLLWFMRFYMVWDMVNNMIDTWHISGAECHRYGH